MNTDQLNQREAAEKNFRADVERTRSLLRLAVGRLELFHAKAAKAALGGSRLERMRNDIPPTPIDPLEATKPSDLHCWVLTIGKVLNRLGPRASAVLCCRLLPRAKSAEAAWETVALRCDMTVHEAKSTFKRAVSAFITSIDRRGITDQDRDPNESSQEIAA